MKFQKRTPDVCTPCDQWDVERDTPWGRMRYIDYRHRIEFGADEYRIIDEYCRDKGIDWFASPWDVASVDFLDGFDVPAHKIASACLTDDELLRAIRASGRTAILSTGMSTPAQIRHAVEVLGSGVLSLGHPLLASMPVRQAARPLMEQLARNTGCTVNLGMRDRGNVVYIETVRADMGNAHLPDIGSTRPLLATAIGRAHHRIGLSPRWYLGAYAFFLDRLFALCQRTMPAEALGAAISASLRAVMVDIDFALSTYGSSGEEATSQRSLMALTNVLDREMQSTLGLIAVQAGRLNDNAERMGTVSARLQDMAGAVELSVGSSVRQTMRCGPVLVDTLVASRISSLSGSRISGLSCPTTNLRFVR